MYFSWQIIGDKELIAKKRSLLPKTYLLFKCIHSRPNIQILYTNLVRNTLLITFNEHCTVST